MTVEVSPNSTVALSLRLRSCNYGCLATHKIPRASTVGYFKGAKELGNWRVNLVNSAALCLGM